MHAQRSLLAIALMVAVTTAQVHATDRHVPTQYATIAAALNAAVPGDRVVLAPGTYEESDLDLPAGITLFGTPSAPASVVIDAGGRGRVLRAESLDQMVQINGVTLTGGRARGDTPYDTSGGGLLVSRAELRLENSLVVSNHADGSGGGLRVSHGKVVLVDTEIRGNTAGKGGGGIDLSYDSELHGLELVFSHNEAAWGGALSVRTASLAAIFESSLVDNRAVDEPGLGGALACDRGSRPTFKRCLLADNEARHGGAVYAADGAEPLLTFVTIDRNEAASGAAFFLRDASARLERAIVSFHDQQAFDLRGDALPEFRESDIYGNEGGDWVGPLAALRGANGNFSADPMYCAPDDRSLREGSPCAPQQSGRGLIGAFGVGCKSITDTPPALEAVSLHAQPNPFNPITEAVFVLPTAGPVRLSVYDIRGRRLALLVDETRPAGENRVRWQARDDDGRSLASGTYLLVLETGGRRLTSKLMLVR